MNLVNQYDEERVNEAATHVCGALRALLHGPRGDTVIFRDSQVSKNGLTNGEAELAICRALNILAMTTTKRMAGFLTERDELDDYVPEMMPNVAPSSDTTIPTA